MLYVAQTRAREKLIMTGVQKNSERFIQRLARPMDGVRVMNAQCYADWMLGAYFPKGADIPVEFPNGGSMALQVVGASSVRRAARGMSEDDFELWKQEAAFLDTGELDDRFAAHYCAPIDTKLPSKLSVTGLTLKTYDVSALPRFMQDEAEITGAQIGTLTHRLMQLLSIAPHTESSVSEELRALTVRGLFTEREAGLVKISAAVEFFSSELGKRLIASPKVEREKEFNLVIEASKLIETPSDTPIMLQGIIDCCFIENGKWILIDHKTTRVDKAHTPRTVAERYRRQLELYKTALERLTGLPVAEGYIYLISVGEAVKLF